MTGEKIGIDVTVTTPEINGRTDGLKVYNGEVGTDWVIKTSNSSISMGRLWEALLGPNASNEIRMVYGTNTGDESLYLSADILITKPDGVTETKSTTELNSDPSASKNLPFTTSFVIGTTVGTYKCEVKLYGRRALTDTKTLLDTDIFYVHCYTEALDIPAPALPDYEYRTAETIEALASAAWTPVPTSLVINPNWWLQFRFNITNNGDEPVNIHIREAMDSKSKIAMTVTDPTTTTSLLPVYMKQIAPETSKKIETLAMRLTESGSWHFEGYVYAQRAYNRILDTTGDGVIAVGDGVRLVNIVSGTFDSDSDGYMSDADLIANNFATPPYWTHYAFTNMDHVTVYDGALITNVAMGAMTESELRTPPEDAFVLQYDPSIIHAYGMYSYYDGSGYKVTANEDEAKANAASGYKALRIEDGKLITF